MANICFTHIAIILYRIEHFINNILNNFHLYRYFYSNPFFISLHFIVSFNCIIVMTCARITNRLLKQSKSKPNVKLRTKLPIIIIINNVQINSNVQYRQIIVNFLRLNQFRCIIANDLPKLRKYYLCVYTVFAIVFAVWINVNRFATVILISVWPSQS